MASIDIVCNNLKAGRPVYLKYHFNDILRGSLTGRTEVFVEKSKTF
jgi:hypothetical protein